MKTRKLVTRTILLTALVAATPWVRSSFGQASWLPPITPATPNGFPQYGSDGSQSSGYDAAHDRLIVFGGVSPFDNNAVSHDTWVLVNASGAGGTPTWTQLHTTNDPPARFRHSAIYDSVTNRMIIFGGTTANGGGAYLSDVWVLTNANGLAGDSSPWIPRTPSGGPPDGRSQNGAIYDLSSNAMAIFFGSDPSGTRTLSDVWVLQDANDITNQPAWQIASQSGDVPSGRGHFATAYDSSSSRVTIFGGCCGYSNATFVAVLDFSTPSVAWTALTPGGTTPPAGDASTFGYDPESNRLVVLDIVPGDGTNGTWLLSDANAVGGTDSWTNIIPGSTPGVPPSSFLVGSGYNPHRKTLVDALNVVQTSTQTPQVWILRDADAFGALMSLPVLFVHGFCGEVQDFTTTEGAVQGFLQAEYPQFYGDPHQYWVYYDGFKVNFEVPNGNTTQTTAPASTRFFAVAFDDPVESLVQNFDPLIVAGISIYSKADELAHIIWKIKSITGAPRVLVVAHSMGGLVSRAYIEGLGSGLTADPYFNDISTLTTIDTPHGGSLLAFLNLIDLGPCWSQESLDKEQMRPSGQNSVIPKLNYFTSGASALPTALRVYSIVSYWTIRTPIGEIDPLDINTDNVLFAKPRLGFIPSEQDLFSNLNNPSKNSHSNLFTVDNPFGTLFALCGTTDLLHFMNCTGSTSQTIAQIENEIQIPALMRQDVTVSPPSATVVRGGSIQFSATTPSKAAAIWSLLEGPTAGNITPDGLYTTGILRGTFHAVAIDSVKSNDYGIATITVTK